MKYIIPKAYEAVEKYKLQQDILDVVNSIIQKDTDKWGIYLEGNAGIGKTFIAHKICSLVNNAIEKIEYKTNEERESKYPVFYNVTDLLMKFKQNAKYRDEGLYYEDVAKHPGLIVLDDFGFDKANDWNTELLFLLIDYRYSHKLPTIFTSNLSYEELKNNQYDKRMVDRILHMCKLFKLNGHNRRL